MDTILGSLAFAGFVAAQFLAVIALHGERLEDADGNGVEAIHLARRQRPRSDILVATVFDDESSVVAVRDRMDDRIGVNVPIFSAQRDGRAGNSSRIVESPTITVPVLELGRVLINACRGSARRCLLDVRQRRNSEHPLTAAWGQQATFAGSTTSAAAHPLGRQKLSSKVPQIEVERWLLRLRSIRNALGQRVR